MKKWLRRVLIGLVALVLLGVAAAWFAPPLLAPWIESAVESELGLSVRIGSVAGPAFRGLTFENVVLADTGPAPMVRRAACRRIDVRYSVLAWLTGSSDWIERVTLVDPDLDLDLAGEVPAALRPTAASAPGAAPSGPILPAIEASGARCLLRHQGRTLTLEEIVLDLEPGAPGTTRGTVRVGHSTLTPAGKAPPLPPLRASITLEPGALTVADIRTGDTARIGDRIRITSAPDRSDATRIEASLSLFGGATVCKVDVAEDRIRAEVKLVSVRTEPVAFLLPAAVPPPDGVIDAEAEVEGRLEDVDSLVGTGRVGFRAARYRGVEKLEATARVGLAGGTVTLRGLEVKSRQGEVRGEGEVDLDGAARLELTGELRPPLPGLDALTAPSPVAVKVTLTGTRAAPRLEAEIRGREITYQQIALRDWEVLASARREPDGRLAASADTRFASLSIHGTEHREGSLRVTAAGSTAAADVNVTGKGERLQFELNGRLERPGPDRLLVTMNELSAWIGRSRVAARGPLTAVVRQGAVELQNPTLTLLDRRATIRGGVSGDRLDLGLALAAVDLGDLCALVGLERRAAGTLDLDLTLTGTRAAPRLEGNVNVSAERFDLMDLGLPLVQNVSIRAAIDPERVRIETCRARIEGGSVEASGQIRLAGMRPEGADGVVTFEGVPLARFSERLGVRLPGSARGRVEIEGPLEAPGLVAQVELRELAWQDWTDGEVTVTGRYADGLARCEKLEVRARGLEASGAFEIPARVSLRPPRLHVAADAAADGSLTWQVSGESPLHRAIPDLTAIAGEASLRDRKLAFRVVEQGVESEPRVEVQGSVNLEGARPRGLDVTASLLGVDLSLLRSWVPLPVEGSLGATVSATGTILAPRVRVDAVVTDGRVREFAMRRFEVSAIATRSAVELYRLEVETDAGLLAGAGRIPLRAGDRPWRAEIDREAPWRLDVQGSALDPGRLLERIGPIRRIEGPLGIVASIRGTAARPTWTGSLVLDGVNVKFAEEGLPRLDALRGRIVAGPDRLETDGLTAELGYERAEIDARLDYSFAAPEVTAVPGLGFGLPSVQGFAAGIRGKRLLLWREDEVRVRADVELRCEGDTGGGLLSGSLAPAGCEYLGDIALSGGAGVPEGLSYRVVVPRLKTAFGRGLRLDVSVRPGNGVLIDTNVARVRARPDLRIRGTAADPLLAGDVSLRGRLFAPAETFELGRGKVQFVERDPLRPYVNAVAEARIAGIEVSVLASGPLDRLKIDFASNPSLPREDVAALVMTGAIRGGLSGDNAAQVVGTGGLRYLFRRFFPHQRGENPSFFADLVDRIYIESIPARTPLDAGNQVRAQFRLFDGFYLQGENDRYGDYNGDLLLRFRFGKPEPEVRPEEELKP